MTLLKLCFLTSSDLNSPLCNSLSQSLKYLFLYLSVLNFNFNPLSSLCLYRYLLIYLFLFLFKSIIIFLLHYYAFLIHISQYNLV